MILKTVIVDDDSVSITMLNKLVKEIHQFDLQTHLTSFSDALSYLTAHHVDVLFLDIEIDDDNGLDLLSYLSYAPKVVVTSAHSHYAIDSFEHGVIDYLKKPVDRGRFAMAVKKVLSAFENAPAQQSEDECIFFVRKGDMHLKIRSEDVIYIQSDSDYVHIHTKDKNKYLAISTMNHLLSILPKGKFLKTHRSYIVRIDAIDRLKDNCVFVQNELIPVSKSHQKSLKSALRIL